MDMSKKASPETIVKRYLESKGMTVPETLGFEVVMGTLLMIGADPDMTKEKYDALLQP